MTKNILVTGVAGFVGTNLAKHLIGQGYKVVGIDISDRHARLKNAALLDAPNFVFKKLNLAQEKLSKSTVPENINAIFHLAALPQVDYSYFHPHHTISNNIESLLNVIEFACQANVPLIFSSSVEVYGGATDQIYTEKDLLSPLSPYAASKVAGEAIIKTYIETQGLRATIFRFTNLYGPWQAPDRLVPRIISQILLGQKATVEKGTNRDFVFISDVCSLLEQAISFNHAGGVFNLSSGNKVDNFTAVQMIMERLPGGDVSIMNPRHRDGRGRFLVSSPEKLHSTTPWRATISLKDGIVTTIDWYGANQVWATQFRNNLQADRNTDAFLTDAKDWRL